MAIQILYESSIPYEYQVQGFLIKGSHRKGICEYGEHIYEFCQTESSIYDNSTTFFKNHTTAFLKSEALMAGYGKSLESACKMAYCRKTNQSNILPIYNQDGTWDKEGESFKLGQWLTIHDIVFGKDIQLLFSSATVEHIILGCHFQLADDWLRMTIYPNFRYHDECISLVSSHDELHAMVSESLYDINHVRAGYEYKKKLLLEDYIGNEHNEYDAIKKLRENVLSQSQGICTMSIPDILKLRQNH